MANLEAVEDGGDGGEGGGVGRGGAGADDVEVVADDVGEQEGFDAGGGGEARELAAFDARDVFADGVDLVDGGAAGQEEAGGGLLFLERDALGGQGHEGGRAAGDEADHQIFASGAGGDLGDARAAGDAALVGDGVAALVEFDAAEFGDVAVLDVDQAGGDAAAEDALGGLRHGGSGLTCSDDVDMAVAVKLRRARWRVTASMGSAAARAARKMVWAWRRRVLVEVMAGRGYGAGFDLTRRPETQRKSEDDFGEKSQSRKRRRGRPSFARMTG